MKKIIYPFQPSHIKVIMGLGNPGDTYYKTRHSIGYRVVDLLAERFGGFWHDQSIFKRASIVINNHKVILIKSNTYMNESGSIIPLIAKTIGMVPSELLVVHDELEKAYGLFSFKYGGSHRGHNGLRSIIERLGDNFYRLRCGIGRPKEKKEVPAYVLQPFEQSEDDIRVFLDHIVSMIEGIYEHSLRG